MSRRLILSLSLLLASVQMAHAQLPVIDAGNLAQNTISAIQSVLTTIQTVLIEANQILDLTPLDEVGTAQGIMQDITQLASVVEQAEGLAFDITTLQIQLTALFDLETAPATRDGLTARLAEIKKLKFQAYSYAAKLHTVLETVFRTTDHLNRLLETVAGIIGNLQGQQTSIQAQLTATKQLANINAQMIVYYRAQTTDRLSDALIAESIAKIQAARMEDWPK
jgi:conjugal transfer/entry exclusion protein